MRSSPLLLLCLVAAARARGPLPAYMLGTFQLTQSEGFSDLMYKIGVGWFKRAVSSIRICWSIMMFYAIFSL